MLTPKRDHRDLLLTDKQWTLAKDLVKVLELFEETTTVVSGQKYVTMSLMLPLVTNLASSADKFAASANSSAARNFAALLKSGLSKKFDLDDIELQSSAVMACALDPRFRNLQFLDDTQREEVRRGTIAEIEALQEKADERQKKAEAERKRSEDAAAQKEDRWEPPKKQIKKEAGCKLSRLFASAEKTPISREESAASCFRSKLEKEVLLYFTEDVICLDDDPLKWWQLHQSGFPFVASLARRYLAIPATSVPSEVVFSAARLLVSKLRSSLRHKTVDASIFLGKDKMLPCARMGVAPVEEAPCEEYDPRIVTEDEIVADLESHPDLSHTDLPHLDMDKSWLLSPNSYC